MFGQTAGRWQPRRRSAESRSDGTKISVSWSDLGYPDYLPATVRDLWARKDLGKSTGSYSATVASHSVVMVTIKP